MDMDSFTKDQSLGYWQLGCNEMFLIIWDNRIGDCPRFACSGNKVEGEEKGRAGSLDLSVCGCYKWRFQFYFYMLRTKPDTETWFYEVAFSSLEDLILATN